MKLRFLLSLLLPLVAVSAPIRDDLAAKSFAFTDSAAPIPYDAEVEFIESTGKQWIDTGILDNQMDFAFECKAYALSSYGAIFGCTDNSSRCWGVRCDDLIFKPTLWQLTNSGIDSRQPATILVDFVNRNYAISTDGDEDFIYGNLVSNSRYYKTGTSVFLFGLHRVSGAYYYYDFMKGAIYWCKIYRNQNLVRDYIPVRFTNEYDETEGALYDRVSHTLFRNAGSGSFIIGPDL